MISTDPSSRPCGRQEASGGADNSSIQLVTAKKILKYVIGKHAAPRGGRQYELCRPDLLTVSITAAAWPRAVALRAIHSILIVSNLRLEFVYLGRVQLPCEVC
jgi:hypothetical protein